jgi:flagellar basal body-associated protein FliL
VKKKGNDTRIAYYAGITVACLVLGFLIGWGYFKSLQQRVGDDVAFAVIGPLNISTQGYSFNATLALRTQPDDADWARKNTPALSDALRQALFDTDPKTMRTPAGLVSIQSALTQTLNRGADKPRVLQVLFTDFILQSDE